MYSTNWLMFCQINKQTPTQRKGKKSGVGEQGGRKESKEKTYERKKEEIKRKGEERKIKRKKEQHGP